MRLELSRFVEGDLDEIAGYIAQDNPTAAVRFVQKLRSRFASLCKHPLIGEDCSLLRPRLRRLTAFGYLIFFRADDSQLEIVRVIHGARDWSKEFD